MEDDKERPFSVDPRDDPRFRITPIQQMAAACSGALLTSVLLTPLDVVKVRLQAQQKNSEIVKKCFLYCNGLMDHLCPCISSNEANIRSIWYSKPIQFSGTTDAFLKIIRHEGITSLWSGLSPTLILALPATVVYFVTYEQLRSRLKNFHHSRKSVYAKNVDDFFYQPAWVPLVAGCTARTWSVMAVSPLELMRIKMQSERMSYFQMHEALVTLLRQQGIKGLWKGVVPTLLRDVPFSGIYWVTYEKIKSCTNRDGSSFFYSFLGGSLSGAIAAILTNPFDVVKTLYQIEMGSKHIPTGRVLTARIFVANAANRRMFPIYPWETFACSLRLPRIFANRNTRVMQTMRDLYTTKGLPGLFSGLLPRLIKVVPACAIMVATFEYGKRYFHQKNSHQFKEASKTELTLSK